MSAELSSTAFSAAAGGFAATVWVALLGFGGSARAGFGDSARAGFGGSARAGFGGSAGLFFGSLDHNGMSHSP
jgi:hypothetical protein